MWSIIMPIVIAPLMAAINFSARGIFDDDGARASAPNHARIVRTTQV